MFMNNMLNFNKTQFLASYGISTQLPCSKNAEISFVGKSNVGKSSLLNCLCNNKKLAKVSSSPGKTTTINFFDMNGNILVDLPGYGFAKRSKQEKLRWQELIEGYFSQDRNFALVIILIDIRHKPTNLDLQMINYIRELGLPFIICFTKADKLSKQKAINASKSLEKLIDPSEHIQTILTSSNTKLGINELKEHIDLAIN